MRRHWRRLLVQFAILILMIAVDLFSQDLFIALIALSIVVLPVANWTIVVLLLWASLQAPDIDSLADRVDDALTLALASTMAAVIGGLVLGKILGLITVIVGPIITIGLGFIVIVMSIPAVSALRTWRGVWLPMLRERQRDET